MMLTSFTYDAAFPQVCLSFQGLAPNNCTPSPASAGQYLAATAQVAAMTAQFFSGLGPENLTFGPGTATSNDVAHALVRAVSALVPTSVSGRLPVVSQGVSGP